MKKSTWVVLALVVVCALIYFFTREGQVSVGVKRIQLPNFPSDTVDRVLIMGKEKISLKKQGDAWFLDVGDQEKPRLVKADQTGIAGMLEAAKDVKHSHYVTNIEEKFRDLGLQGEEATEIKIFSGETLVWNLVLGKNAGSSGRYAKLIDAKEAYVVRGSFWALTRNGPADWRDHDILPVQEGEITSFRLEKAGVPYIALVKEGDDWAFDKTQKDLPSSFRVDKSALAGLVKAAASLRASGFVDVPEPLLDPLVTLHIGAGQKTYAVNLYSGTADKYRAKLADSEQIYEIAKFNFDRVNKSIDDLRDMSLLNFDKTAIETITVKIGAQQVIVQKKENAWIVEEPKKLPAGFEFEPVAVDDMLALLSGLKAQRLATAKDVPANANWSKNWVVSLKTASGQETQLFLGKSKQGQDEYLAKGNIDQLTYVLKGARIKSLTSGLNAFKKEEFDLPPVDERTKGFESLPIDIQRKLLDATKKKN